MLQHVPPSLIQCLFQVAPIWAVGAMPLGSVTRVLITHTHRENSAPASARSSEMAQPKPWTTFYKNAQSLSW